MGNFMNDFYVYCYFRPTGEPCYIGKGRGRRWKDHLIVSKICNSRLKRIIEQSNGDVPHVKLHTNLTQAQANDYEIALIRAIGRGRNGPLVNMTDGGEGSTGLTPSDYARTIASKTHKGKIVSASTRLKMRVAKLGKAAHNRGRPLSPEHRTRLSEIQNGKVMSPESSERKSAALKGKPWSQARRAAQAKHLSKRAYGRPLQQKVP